MLGQFALGLAVCAPVFMFANLHLRSVQATDVKHDFTFGHYLGLRLITTPLALSAIALIVFVAGYQSYTSLVILVVGLAKAFESLSDVFYGLFQQRERMDRIAKAIVVKGSLSIGALYIGIYLTDRVIWGIIGLALVWALILLGCDVRNAVVMLKASAGHSMRVFAKGAPLSPRWEIGKLRKLAWLSLPLAFVAMLVSLYPNIPRYIIERYLGKYQLGIFSAIAYLMVAGSTVVNALGQSAAPKLAAHHTSADAEAYRRLLLKLILSGSLLGAAGILVSWLAGSEILSIVYSQEYGDYAYLLVWMMIAAAFSYVASFIWYGMMAARYFAVQMPLYIIVVTAALIACFLLIPTYGLLGAAFAMVIASLVQLLGSLAVILHVFHTQRKQQLS